MLRILGDQFKSVVVYLLIAAVGISFAPDDRTESIAIATVLVINTIIGFATELRARRAMEALLLDLGRRIPADARLIEATDFRRRLHAVEALGSATVVYTRQNSDADVRLMTLVRLWTVGRDVSMRDAPHARDAAVMRALEVAALASRPQRAKR